MMVKKGSVDKCVRTLAIVLAMTGASALAAKPNAAAQGKVVFEQCKVCHATNTPAQKVGPSLMHLFKHARLKNGQPMNEKNIRLMINNCGSGMPGYQRILSAEEKDQLIAYLKTL
jgi:mono/diheme cytochrome c family protein